MTHGAAARAAIVSQFALLVLACTPMGNNSPAASSTASGTGSLTADQRAGGWRPLFDGTNTSAWRGYKSATLPAGWSIVDGVLTKSTSVGDLITKDQFGNFELALDWKLSPGGNAGVFIAARRSTITSTGARLNISCWMMPDIPMDRVV